nr:hypothetical protein [uncultured Campylobacter sp.]
MKKFTDGKKEILLQTQGLSLISKTLQNGKERLSSKEFANHDALQKAFVKKQVDVLKKGFIYENKKVKFGEALAHTYIGGGYSGALGFAEFEDKFYVYKCNFDEHGCDYLIVLDDELRTLAQIELPKILAWKMTATKKALVLDLDHEFFLFDGEKFSRLFEAWGITGGGFSSSLSGNGEILACGTDGILAFGSDKKLNFKTDFSAKAIGFGNKICVACGDENGKNVARLYRLKDFAELCRIECDVGYIHSLNVGLIKNDAILVVNNGFDELYFWDVASKKRLSVPKTLPRSVMRFATNDQIFLTYFYGRFKAFSLKDFRLLGEFECEHCVKTAAIEISGERLYVRTDYGFFSIYSLAENGIKI